MYIFLLAAVGASLPTGCPGVLRLDSVWEQLGAAFNSLSWACQFTSFKIAEPFVAQRAETAKNWDPIRTYGNGHVATDARLSEIFDTRATSCFIREDAAKACCPGLYR